MRVRIDTLMSVVAAAALAAAPAPVLAQSGDANTTERSPHQMTPAQIRDAIEDELLFDPGVPSHKVTVEFLNGIVTLSGTVDNLLAKERATLVAETVRGVESVVNRITVMPIVKRSAADIRSDVVDALAIDPATDSYEVSVTADDSGKVTLNGVVDSWPERRLSERVAKGVAGVTELDNAITVNPPASRPDSEIQHDVEQALHWSVLVDDGLIDVNVEDGAVRLTGTVGSAAEKRQAELRAWTSGVSSVDATGLMVKDWARDDDLRKTKYVVRPDEDIRDAIERALVYDPRVNSLNVETEVTHGYVTLRGTVDSVRARRAAVEDARNTVGVTSVRDRLKVDSTDVRRDTDLANAVRDAFERDPGIERHDVVVSVVGGKAYLYGTVDNFYEKALADDLAASVPGITDIDNNLMVRSENWVGYDPFLGDPYLYGFDWYDYTPRHTWMRDDEIAREIESQLWWSPFVDADDVHVSVEDGVATLTGTVDSWSEYRAATENAYEGGAVWVDNDLIVEMLKEGS